MKPIAVPPEALALLAALEASAAAQWLRIHSLAYAAINALHIIGIALLFGPIAVWDWRVLRGRGAAELELLRRTASIGAMLAIVTGACLFSVKPLEYATNAAFQYKLTSIAAALLNVAAAHLLARHDASATGTPTRVAAALSLALWLAAIGLGRWIAFV